jgi:hypothetical protein
MSENYTDLAAVNNLSDALTSVITIIGTKLGAKLTEETKAFFLDYDIQIISDIDAYFFTGADIWNSENS